MKMLYVGIAAIILLAAAVSWVAIKTKANLPWARYTAAVYHTFPSQRGTLARGATDAQIAKLKQAIPYPIPAELISALELNNGGAGRFGDNSIFYGAIMLSVDGIIRDYENWVVISKEDPENWSDPYSSFPLDAVKPMYANAAWVPIIADGAGNNIGIDYDPGPTGKTGQIISFGADEIEKLVIADSYPAFLALMQGLLVHPQVKPSESRGFSLSDVYIVDALRPLLKQSALD